MKWFTRRKILTLVGVLGLGYAIYAYAHTNTTTISRSQLDHPDLGYEGGATLHNAITAMWEKVGDNANSRYHRGFGVADSVTTAYVHNFGVDFSELEVRLYTGPENNLVRVFDPAGDGWTIAATSGSEKTSIDVTTPASGAPHDYSLIVVHGGGSGAVGGSGSGEISYVENGNAEEATTSGWATYQDAAATTPVDGTGGSPTVTFLRTTSAGEALRGDASFEIAKDAADRQGEGASYDIVIDEADQNKLLKVQFDYKTSADYANDDIAIYIYDVDGAALITPETNVELKASTDAGKHAVSWLSTGSTNYRVIFHVASSNALAYDVFLDNIIVGPGIITQSAALGGWESSDSSLNLTWSTENIRVRRVGDSLEMIGHAIFDTGTGDIYINLPSGLTWSTDLVTTEPSGNRFFGHLLGKATAVDAPAGGALTYNGGVYARDDDASRTQLAIGRLHSDGSASGASWANTSPFTWASGDQLNFKVTVPIEEWKGEGVVNTLVEDNLTEWKPFTPDFSGNVSFDNNDSYYRRVGDTLQMAVRVSLTGAIAAGDIAVDLPFGLTGDENKMPSSIIVGNIRVTDGSGDHNGTIFWSNSNDDIRFGGDDGTGIWNATTPFVWADNNLIAFTASVPIVEWGGSQNSLVGFSEATDSTIGLAGPAGFDSDATGESCTTNCDACVVTNLITSVVGGVVNYSLQVAADATSTGTLYECDFNAPKATAFTSEYDARGVCVAESPTAANVTQGYIQALASSGDLRIRIQDPKIATATGFTCTGQFLIK